MLGTQCRRPLTIRTLTLIMIWRVLLVSLCSLMDLSYLWNEISSTVHTGKCQNSETTPGNMYCILREGKTPSVTDHLI